jgi:molybdate transport system substrate-binding protein
MKLRIRHGAITVWTTPGVAAVLPLALVAALSGCGQQAPQPTTPSSSSGQGAATSITVFAAASLKSAFTLLAGKFQSDNPGATIDFNFATSSELANKLTQGAAADVFATADSAQMDTVVKADLASSDPVNFASNTLVIVTAPGDPKQVRSFADLARPDLRVAVCQASAPCGSAAQRIEDNTGVHINPASEEPVSAGVLAKVTSGEVDAGLVFVTDAHRAGDKVSAVTFPESATAVTTYSIVILKHPTQPALAQKFVDLLTGATGQRVLTQAGFNGP